MTISRAQVVQRVRQAGFTFKKQGSRVDIYRQQGTKQRVALPRRDLELVRQLDVAGQDQHELAARVKAIVGPA